jgi:hypothetical protein
MTVGQLKDALHPLRRKRLVFATLEGSPDPAFIQNDVDDDGWGYAWFHAKRSPNNHIILLDEEVR